MAIFNQHHKVLSVLATIVLAMLALWHPSSSQAKPISLLVTNQGSNNIRVYCGDGTKDTLFRKVKPGTAETIPVPPIGGGGGTCWSLDLTCQWMLYVEIQDAAVCQKKCYSVLADGSGFHRRNGRSHPWEFIQPDCLEDGETYDYDESRSEFGPKY